MKVLNQIINDRNITTDNINVLLSGVVLSGLVFTIRNVINNVKGKLSENVIKEDIEPSDTAI